MDYICNLCNREFKSITALSSHVRQKHKDITNKEYYDKFLKKNKNEGVCYCGKPTTYYGLKTGYLRFCSQSCAVASSDIQEKIKKTNIKNNGVDHVNKRLQKAKETKLRLYGDEQYNNKDKIKNTLINKEYDYDKWLSGLRNTWKEKSKEEISEITNRTVKTKNKLYGENQRDIIEKMRKTCLDKYGFTTFSQTETSKNITRDFWKNIDNDKMDNINEKRRISWIGKDIEVIEKKKKETCLEKYGVDHYSKTTEQRNLISNNAKLRWVNGNYGRFCFELNGKKYRSSWEALFHFYKSTLLYESIKIPYIFNNTNKRYFVDFEDNTNKILYEVKFTGFINEMVNSKIEAAEKWCKENNYTYIMVTERWFKDNYVDIFEFLKKNKPISSSKELVDVLNSINNIKK